MKGTTVGSDRVKKAARELAGASPDELLARVAALTLELEATTLCAHEARTDLREMRARLDAETHALRAALERGRRALDDERARVAALQRELEEARGRLPTAKLEAARSSILSRAATGSAAVAARSWRLYRGRSNATQLFVAVTLIALLIVGAGACAGGALRSALATASAER